MHAYANHLVSYLFAQSWQIALLAGMVGLLSLALRNRSAHLRYLLWLTVLAKCLVPPVLSVPLAVLPGSPPPSSSLGEIVLPEEHVAPETPAPVAVAPPPPVTRSAWVNVPGLTALAWLAGALLFLLWIGGRAVRYTAWLRARRRPLPPVLEESIRDLSTGFKFRTPPQIWLVEDIGQPFVWGLFRGSVYLPADFVGLDGSDRQRSVLAHEFSHMVRYDAGINLLQVLAQAAYWFHPLVWWANRRIRQEREKCCDEMAVAHLHTAPEHYTGAIVDTLAAERRSAHPIPSLAIVGSVRDIEERIKTMLRPGKTFRCRPSLVAAAVALLIALVTLPTALVLTAKGQTPPPAQTGDKAATIDEGQWWLRYPARTFNSQMSFDVIVAPDDTPNVWTTIGHTPCSAPLQVPACYLWGVRLSCPVQGWDLLAREMNKNEVPHLTLTSPTDSDVQHLAALTGLQDLDLASTRVTDAGLEHLRGLTTLQGLRLSATQITDAGLAHLKGLTELQSLDLVSTAITSAGLAHLKGLVRLQRLALTGTQVSDAGLEHLKNLTDLHLLNLSATGITDAGLKHVKGLDLCVLMVSNPKITDAGLAHLKGMTRLQRLNLNLTRVTDGGLENLANLTEMQWLHLSVTRITDAGLAHLKNMTKLEDLSLSNNRITDAGLVHLQGLKQLQRLNLTGTQVTEAGVQQLKQSLPKATIERGELPL